MRLTTLRVDDESEFIIFTAAVFRGAIRCASRGLLLMGRAVQQRDSAGGIVRH